MFETLKSDPVWGQAFVSPEQRQAEREANWNWEPVCQAPGASLPGLDDDIPSLADRLREMGRDVMGPEPEGDGIFGALGSALWGAVLGDDEPAHRPIPRCIDGRQPETDLVMLPALPDESFKDRVERSRNAQTDAWNERRDDESFKDYRDRTSRWQSERDFEMDPGSQYLQ